MRQHPASGEIRRIIAAHRSKYSEAPFGTGYGPDWRFRIKRHVIAFIENGIRPPFMEELAPAE